MKHTLNGNTLTAVTTLPLTLKLEGKVVQHPVFCAGLDDKGRGVPAVGFETADSRRMTLELDGWEEFIQSDELVQVVGSKATIEGGVSRNVDAWKSATGSITLHGNLGELFAEAERGASLAKTERILKDAYRQKKLSQKEFVEAMLDSARARELAIQFEETAG